MPKLGWSFKTNKPLCHGLGDGWLPQRKSLVQVYIHTVYVCNIYCKLLGMIILQSSRNLRM